MGEIGIDGVVPIPIVEVLAGLGEVTVGVTFGDAEMVVAFMEGVCPSVGKLLEVTVPEDPPKTGLADDVAAVALCEAEEAEFERDGTTGELGVTA
jgi:hypothetical protein